MRRSLCPLVLVFALGCKSDPGGEGAACKAKEECAEGLHCVDEKCTALAAETEPPTAWCGSLDRLAGEWTFDTTVSGGEDLATRGINGHYQLAVATDQCTANIQLTKTGHDTTKYSESKVQRADAPVSESKSIPLAAEATVALKGKPTHTFTFVVRDGQLFGFWRSVGEEWSRAGMWGFLRGTRTGQSLGVVEDFTAQPCEVACLTSCDAARREADQTLDTGALAACMTACGAGERIPCPLTGEMPPALRLAVEGPVASEAEACTKIAANLGKGVGECNAEPLVGGKPAKRSLDGRALGGVFEHAKLVQVGFAGADGYAGGLYLLMQTKAGWYWTAEVANLSLTTREGATLTIGELVLRTRDLLLGFPGREVIAEVGIESARTHTDLNEVERDSTDRTLICTGGDPPTCISVMSRWSSERALITQKGDDPTKHPELFAEAGELYSSFLPDDRISVSTPADARPEDRELAGLYVWPVAPPTSAAQK